MKLQNLLVQLTCSEPKLDFAKKYSQVKFNKRKMAETIKFIDNQKSAKQQELKKMATYLVVIFYLILPRFSKITLLMPLSFIYLCKILNQQQMTNLQSIKNQQQRINNKNFQYNNHKITLQPFGEVISLKLQFFWIYSILKFCKILYWYNLNPVKMEQDASLEFSFNQALPQSLIMLQRDDTILSLLLTSPQKIAFIWLDQSQHPSIQKQIRNIQRELQQQIITYCSLELLSTHVKQMRFKQNILVICSPEMSSKVLKTKMFKIIVLFPSEENSVLQDSNALIYQAQNKQQLMDILIFQKLQNASIQYKCLPNFLNLNNQIQTSNSMVSTLWAMVNTPNDSVSLNSVIDSLKKLFDCMKSIKLIPQKEIIQQFLEDLRKENMSCEKCLYWYTLQSPVFKLVNNLLRATEQPCILFYIWPYFKSLFNSISSLYQKQNCKTQFICYRGGKITHQEIKTFKSNVAGIVQNLGFLSTSLDRQISQAYIKNVFFTIYVSNSNPSLFSSTPGFAIISQYSNFVGEQEILFNPLNFFKILSIKEVVHSQRTIFQVDLEFKSFSNNSSSSSFATKDDKIYKQIFRKQQLIKVQSCCQGYALNHSYNFTKGLAYWHKFIQILEKKYLKDRNILQYKQKQKVKYLLEDDQKRKYIQGLANIAMLYKKKGQNKKAIQFSSIIQQVLKVQASLGYKFYVSILLQIGLIYCRLENYDKSQQISQMIKQIIQKQVGLENDLNAQTQKNMALIFLAKNMMRQSLYFYVHSAMLKQRLFGPNNFECSETLIGVGQYFWKIKNFSKAQEMYWRSCKIIEKIYGTGLFYANTLEKLAYIYYQTGQFSTSLSIIKQVLLIKQRLLEPHHIQIGEILSFQADVYYSINQPTDAVKCYEKSNQILQKCGYENGNHFAHNLNNLANIYLVQKQQEKALAHLQHAKNILQRTNSYQTYLFGTILTSIAAIYTQRRQFERASKLLLKCKEIQTKNCNGDKLLQVKVLLSSAEISYQKGDLNEALTKIYQSLDIKRSIFGKTHFSLCLELMKIANIEVVLNYFSRFNLTIIQLEAMTLKFYGTNHPFYFHMLILKTAGQQKKGNIKNYLYSLLKSINANPNFFNKNKSTYVQALKFVGKIFIRIGCLNVGLRLYKIVLDLIRKQSAKSFSIQFQVFQQIIKAYTQALHTELARNFLVKNKISFQQNKKSKKQKLINKLLWKKRINQIQKMPIFADF